jgi:hypothetical protein
MAFLPNNSNHFNAEFKHLYLSLAYVRSMQPKNIKTDFLIFTPPNNEGFLQEIGCTNQQRSSFLDDERCIIVTHIPLEVGSLFSFSSLPFLDIGSRFCETSNEIKCF